MGNEIQVSGIMYLVWCHNIRSSVSIPSSKCHVSGDSML